MAPGSGSSACGSVRCTGGCRRKVVDKPGARELCHPTEGTGLLEQMPRSRHDLEPLLGSGEPIECPAIDLEHDRIVGAADDEQRGREHGAERLRGARRPRPPRTAMRR